MHQVIYFSRSGNTRKVADTIASEIGVKAIAIKDAKLNQKTDVIFLGSGCYGNKASPKMIEFITTNDFQDRQIALFGTSGNGQGIHLQDMAEILKKQGALLKGIYDCKGKTFGLINRSHPGKENLTKARKFVHEMIKSD